MEGFSMDESLLSSVLEKSGDSSTSLTGITVGQSIITSEGYKNIENIAVGDLVLNYKAEFDRVVDTSYVEYTGDVYSVQVNGYYKPLQTIDTHQFYVCRGGKVDRNEGHYLWVPAKELILGDKLVFCCDSATKSKDPYPLEVAGLLGSFVVFGYIDSKNRVTFNTENKQEVYNYIKSCTEKLNIALEEFVFNGSVFLTLADSSYIALCRVFGGKGDRLIPESIVNASIPFLREFVHAFMLSNKEKHKSMFFRATSAVSVLYGFQRILYRLNSFSNVYKCESKNGFFDYYALVMNSKEMGRVGISGKDIWFRNFHHAFLRLDDISISQYSGKLHSLSLESGTSFCNHVIVSKF
jgi:hypothetical protein